jgi:hypothetical protein
MVGRFFLNRLALATVTCFPQEQEQTHNGDHPSEGISSSTKSRPKVSQSRLLTLGFSALLIFWFSLMVFMG